MFQLLQPLWLFAIGGIIIPVIIHLWNIRGGKTLQVGSILLLQESARQQARSLRLKDILLLILRCLLIIILSFLLAKPTWKKQLTSINEKGWVMIEKESMKEAYKNFKPAIDSLITAGYKFHYFNKDFKEDKLEDALKNMDTTPENKISYWALLKQLNEEVPAELPVYLFTNNQLKRFTGTRPEVSMNVKWLTYTSEDTIANSIIKAYKTYDDSIKIISAASKSTATFYNTENISLNGNSKYKLINDTTLISSDNTNDKIKIDISAINITIYTDQFITDANYLKAAFDAVKQYTKFAIKTTIVNNIDDIKAGNDWLFWLSEKPLPVKLPSKIFIYEKGKEQSINSWITPANNFSVNQEAIHLSRFIQTSSSSSNFETIWKDGFGHAVLSLEKTNISAYHFYSRFNPDWNDLPWSSQFVEMMFDLSIKQDINIKNFDKRIIDAAQLQPQITKEKKAFDKEKFVEITDLSKLFWLLAFIVFCAERFVSLTRKQSLKNRGNAADVL